jgi:sugar phosphate isomerase/epimerase
MTHGLPFVWGYRSPGLTLLTPEEKMNLARRLGMRIIEPTITKQEIDSAEDARAYKNAADEAGIRIASTAAVLPHFAGEAEFRAAVENTMELMRILGVNYCFSVVKNNHQAADEKEAWELLVKRSQWIADQFASSRYMYSIEVDKACFIETLPRTIQYLQDINRSNVCINYDPTNYYLNHEDPIEVFHALQERIVSVHIKDGVRSKRSEVAVGTGELNYDLIFRTLLRTGKTYNLFIEHCKSEEELIAAAAHIQTVLDRIQKEAYWWKDE